MADIPPPPPPTLENLVDRLRNPRVVGETALRLEAAEHIENLSFTILQQAAEIAALQAIHKEPQG